MSRLDNCSKALFVVGRMGSGKTTLCRLFEGFGFNRISASNFLRTLYAADNHDKPSTVELAMYGGPSDYRNVWHSLIAYCAALWRRQLLVA